MSRRPQRVYVLLLMLNCTLFPSARIIYVSSRLCSNSDVCLSQDKVRDFVACCQLEYVSESTRTSCSNLTIFIGSDVVHLKGIAKFEGCHNLSLIGLSMAKLSSITCEETSNNLEDTNETENVSWKDDVWTTLKSDRQLCHIQTLPY